MKELVLDLLERVYEVNQQTEHEVFFRYSPHVDLVELDVHLGGFLKSGRPHLIGEIITRNSDRQDNLHKCIEVMEKLLNDRLNLDDFKETRYDKDIKEITN